MKSLLVLNGPNLNLLGLRQPEIYGRTTLAEIDALCVATAKELGVNVTCKQSNHEGVLIDEIHAARGTIDGIVLNAGAYTHTSIAIMDAISSAEVPVIELHLSNVHAREDFRHKSFIAKVAIGTICGLGPDGYPKAMKALLKNIGNA